MKITAITLFPEIMDMLRYGIVGRALDKGLLTLSCLNPRDFSSDSHRTVDNAAYGGGPGMVMMAEPLGKAILAAKAAQKNSKVIYLSPQGKRFDQAGAKQLAMETSLIFVSGRYEGIDQRVIDKYVDEEWSIGDFVMSGGEIAACAMVDAIARMLPGVIGDKDSVTQDTFYEGRLKHPQYTRPEVFEGLEVPKVLLGGNHADIDRWRLKHTLGNTWSKRPDLLAATTLTETETLLLNEFINEQKQQ